MEYHFLSLSGIVLLASAFCTANAMDTGREADNDSINIKTENIMANPNPNMVSIEDMRIEPYENNPSLYVIKADVKTGGETMTWQSIPTTESSVKYFQSASAENRIGMFRGFCEDFSQAYHGGNLDITSLNRTFSGVVPMREAGGANISDIKIEKVGAHSEDYRISAFVKDGDKTRWVNTVVAPEAVERWLNGNPEERAASFKYLFPFSHDRQFIASIPSERLKYALSFDINIAENIHNLQNNPLKNDVMQQDKLMLTAVVGGQSINIELSSKQQQKLMAMDESHRVKLLEKMVPDLKDMSMAEKTAFMESVSDQLFSRPAIFASSMSDTQSDVSQQKPAVSASSLAAASYTAILAENQNNSQEQSMSRGI